MCPHVPRQANGAPNPVGKVRFLWGMPKLKGGLSNE